MHPHFLHVTVVRKCILKMPLTFNGTRRVCRIPAKQGSFEEQYVQ